jgi:3-dehydroquinate dehydratase type I
MPGIAAQVIKHLPSPRILGILTAEMLASRRYPEDLWTCGGVELRADGVPFPDILPVLQDFTAEKNRQAFDGPVVFTLRLRRDGGAWEDSAARERESIWRALPPGSCDFADLEIEEIDGVGADTVEALRRAGIGILLSHHVFAPPAGDAAAAFAAWNRTLDKMRGHHPAGVKVAVALDADASAARPQAEALLHLARRIAGEYPISCVLGMGEWGRLTRLVCPLLGCPLTYGYLGHKAVAPGQLPAHGMRRFFQRARAEGHPPDGTSEGGWLDWAAELWSRVEHAD